MRRFSSEGCLLDIDFLPWRRVITNKENRKTAALSSTFVDGEFPRPPFIQEPIVDEKEYKKLNREQSTSAENLSVKVDRNHLAVCVINEGFRAYSDSQLSPAAQGSSDSVEKEDPPSTSPSADSCEAFKPEQKHHHRLKLTAAKLHLKSLFGLSPHSSNSNLSCSENKDSLTERRSRLLFMHQWSMVGHSKGSRISREELEKWAESLDALLNSHLGVSVFGAFLRSQFSEENLQFYQACEQYKHSSNKFSLQRRAKDICATYILPGSPREVNLDSKTRDLTIQLLQAPSHTSLNYAQKRIYSLLDLDCYPRFLQSIVYQSLLKEAE
ncbi:regulator of G-protein signaling 8 [Synchiropus picturatus]